MRTMLPDLLPDLLPPTTLQVSVRFWPGLWRGSEGFASREELLLVMRDVEQVDRRILEPIDLQPPSC